VNEVHLLASVKGCKRGVRFIPSVLDGLKHMAEEGKCSLSFLVNKACLALLEKGLPEELVHKIRVEAEIEELKREERCLRQNLTLILRSGTYLRNYAKSLLEGDKEEISKLKSRNGIYARLDSKELDVILRILARREAIAKRLVELMDEQLPKERYDFGLTEHGWKINRKGGEKGI
jgi:hypothetical protein